MSPAPVRPPSIATRLAWSLGLWSVVWGLAVGAAVWLAASREVDELLDEGLRSSAELLAGLVLEVGVDHPGDETGSVVGSAADEHFAWQLVDAQGRVLRRSPRAPATAWHRVAQAGFDDVPQWRLFGLAAGRDGRMLYAAQTRAEREEARVEVALGAVVAALAVGLLGHIWLRARVRHELDPLERLSERLGSWHLDGGVAPPSLGPAVRSELVPVHEAIDDLAARLSVRVTNEQAFSAHAAHALRTPLAGIDAQLAVAVREAPPALAERLQRVRGAAARLQSVVVALLGLFRSADGAAALQRRPLRLAELLARLPQPALELQCDPAAVVDADADLLSAALLNLFDNAARHGARRVVLHSGVDGRRLRLDDDGRGLEPARRDALDAALVEQRYGDIGGLGLMLADRVARAHGGQLRLLPSERGLAVLFDLGMPSLTGPATASPDPR